MTMANNVRRPLACMLNNVVQQWLRQAFTHSIDSSATCSSLAKHSGLHHILSCVLSPFHFVHLQLNAAWYNVQKTGGQNDSEVLGDLANALHVNVMVVGSYGSLDLIER